nr:hypothetical protein [Streptomyces griseus]
MSAGTGSSSARLALASGAGPSNSSYTSERQVTTTLRKQSRFTAR